MTFVIQPYWHFVINPPSKWTSTFKAYIPPARHKLFLLAPGTILGPTFFPNCPPPHFFFKLFPPGLPTCRSHVTLAPGRCNTGKWGTVRDPPGSRHWATYTVRGTVRSPVRSTVKIVSLDSTVMYPDSTVMYPSYWLGKYRYFKVMALTRYSGWAISTVTPRSQWSRDKPLPNMYISRSLCEAEGHSSY